MVFVDVYKESPSFSWDRARSRYSSAVLFFLSISKAFLCKRCQAWPFLKRLEEKSHCFPVLPSRAAWLCSSTPESGKHGKRCQEGKGKRRKDGDLHWMLISFTALEHAHWNQESWGGVCVQMSLKGNTGTEIKAPLSPPVTAQVTHYSEQACMQEWVTNKREESTVSFGDIYRF